jgi:hypothetical protein
VEVAGMVEVDLGNSVVDLNVVISDRNTMATISAHKTLNKYE